MKNKLTKYFVITMMIVGTVLPVASAQAMYVYDGVDWDWGTTPWSVWSTITNNPRKVREVQATAYANNRYYWGRCDERRSTIDVGWSFGGRRAYYNYYTYGDSNRCG